MIGVHGQWPQVNRVCPFVHQSFARTDDGAVFSLTLDGVWKVILELCFILDNEPIIRKSSCKNIYFSKLDTFEIVLIHCKL